MKILKVFSFLVFCCLGVKLFAPLYVRSVINDDTWLLYTYANQGDGSLVKAKLLAVEEVKRIEEKSAKRPLPNSNPPAETYDTIEVGRSLYRFDLDIPYVFSGSLTPGKTAVQVWMHHRADTERKLLELKKGVYYYFVLYPEPEKLRSNFIFRAPQELLKGKQLEKKGYALLEEEALLMLNDVKLRLGGLDLLKRLKERPGLSESTKRALGTMHFSSAKEQEVLKALLLDGDSTILKKEKR